eukprot:GEMP01097225.1.p1 GENE.GEMP01097225.1~~GEMP01097225.1.p1  ORF type:complete len:127 (+),score=20.49 GEMP01097225.1:152-532(+)
MNRVAVEVRIDATGNTVSTEWYLSPTFHTFLRTRTLAIVEMKRNGNALRSMVRLLHKAAELQLQYELPSKADLRANIAGKHIGKANIEKYDNLPERMKARLTEYFVVEKYYSIRMRQDLLKFTWRL